MGLSPGADYSYGPSGTPIGVGPRERKSQIGIPVKMV